MSSEIPTPSAVDRAYRHVVSEIVSGRLPAGSLLTEGDTALALGISRTPVREALLLAEARGLLTLFPKRGAIVTAIHEDDVTDLLETRIMLETAAVRHLASHPEQIAELTQDLIPLLAAQDAAVRDNDALAYARADFAFHARIVAESRNRIIEDFFEQLGPRLERLTHRVVSRGDARRDRLTCEHRTLAELAGSADIEGFALLLNRHVHNGHFGSEL